MTSPASIHVDPIPSVTPVCEQGDAMPSASTQLFEAFEAPVTNGQAVVFYGRTSREGADFREGLFLWQPGSALVTISDSETALPGIGTPTSQMSPQGYKYYAYRADVAGIGAFSPANAPEACNVARASIYGDAVVFFAANWAYGPEGKENAQGIFHYSISSGTVTALVTTDPTGNLPGGALSFPSTDGVSAAFLAATSPTGGDAGVYCMRLSGGTPFQPWVANGDKVNASQTFNGFGNPQIDDGQIAFVSTLTTGPGTYEGALYRVEQLITDQGSEMVLDLLLKSGQELDGHPIGDTTAFWPEISCHGGRMAIKAYLHSGPGSVVVHIGTNGDHTVVISDDSPAPGGGFFENEFATPPFISENVLLFGSTMLDNDFKLFGRNFNGSNPLEVVIDGNSFTHDGNTLSNLYANVSCMAGTQLAGHVLWDSGKEGIYALGVVV